MWQSKIGIRKKKTEKTFERQNKIIDLKFKINVIQKKKKKLNAIFKWRDKTYFLCNLNIFRIFIHIAFGYSDYLFGSDSFNWFNIGQWTAEGPSK